MAEETKDQKDVKTEPAETPKEDATPVVAEDKPAENSPELEDKTANDGSLLINQADSAAAETPVATTPPADAEPTLVPTPEPVTAEQPVVVNPQDVEEANKSETENLQAEIEGLTGEIQALESKIERLTGSTSAPAENSAPKVEEKAPEPKQEPEKPLEMPKPLVETKPEVAVPVSTMPEPKPEMPKPASTPSPVTDIYSNVGTPEPKKPTNDLNDISEPEGPSAVGMIGEVLAILGIILTIILVASPLFKETIGTTLFATVTSVGWLTTVATLALGFLLLVLGKARASMIIIGLLFLLIAGFMYVGLNYPSLLGPIQGSLDSVFGFYR